MTLRRRRSSRPYSAAARAGEEEQGAGEAAGPSCAYCGRVLALLCVHVRCEDAACRAQDVRHCVDCFSVGAALVPHDGAHPYTLVDSLDASVYDDAWSAKDELALLNALSEHGLHKWHQVALAVGKSAARCEAHYYQVYIQGADAPLPTPLDPSTKVVMPQEPATPTPTPTPSDTPRAPRAPRSTAAASDGRTPRKADGACSELRGYLPKRGDFEVEYDDDAEEDLVAALEVAPSDPPDIRELKCRMLELYDLRLTVRDRVKGKALGLAPGGAADGSDARVGATSGEPAPPLDKVRRSARELREALRSTTRGQRKRARILRDSPAPASPALSADAPTPDGMEYH